MRKEETIYDSDEDDVGGVVDGGCHIIFTSWIILMIPDAHWSCSIHHQDSIPMRLHNTQQQMK